MECKMKTLITVLMFVGISAQATQIIDLKQNEVSAANFLAQCSSELAGKTITVLSGIRASAPQGIAYTFDLKSSDGTKLTLEVRWTAHSRSFECSTSKSE